jgi:hypothetical protein
MSRPGSPNFAKLKDLAMRARSLKLAGELDYQTFRALLEEALVAANGNPSLTDILAPYASPDWVRRIYEEEHPPQDSKRSVA